MSWLEPVPDDARHVVTVLFSPDGTDNESSSQYPVSACERYQPSVWYIDIIKGLEYDEDGICCRLTFLRSFIRR